MFNYYGYMAKSLNKKINMKNLKYIFLFLVTVTFCAWMWLPKSNKHQIMSETGNNNIKITISLSKDTFFIGESVFLTINIKNNSGKLDSIAILNTDELAQRILVKNNNNETSEYKGPVITYLKEKYTKIKPYEVLTYVVDLQIHYGFNSFTKNIIGFYSYFPSGKYIVRSDFAKNLYENEKLDIHSNEISFMVFEENIVENKQSQELKKIYLNSITGGSEKAKIAITSLMDLLGNYPNSAYFYKAYNDMRTYLRKYEINLIDMSNDYLAFINKYPNSPYTKTAMLLYVDNVINTQHDKKAEDLLSELETIHQNTKVSDFAIQLRQVKKFQQN